MGKWIDRILKGQLGWKTLAGALVIAISAIGQASGLMTPEQSESLFRLGEVVGLVGLRDAMSKLPT